MVKLIRKNNAEITAYQDSVMFNLAKGTNGIIKNVGSEFALTYTWQTSTFLLGSGMGVAYGRQFEIPAGDFSGLSLDNYPTPSYFIIYFKIDLSNPSAETVTLEFDAGTADYPAISGLGDDLTKYPNGICRVPIYKLKKLGQSAAVTKIAKILLPDTTPFADRAHIATEAELALNAEKVNDLIIEQNYNTKKVYVNHKNTANEELFIERKLLLFNGDFRESAMDIGQQEDYPFLELASEVNFGDTLEFHVYSRSLQHYQVLRVKVSNISVDKDYDYDPPQSILPIGAQNLVGVRLLTHTSNYTTKNGSDTSNYFRYDVDVAILQLSNDGLTFYLLADWRVTDIYNTAGIGQVPFGRIAINKIFKIVGGS